MDETCPKCNRLADLECDGPNSVGCLSRQKDRLCNSLRRIVKAYKHGDLGHAIRDAEELLEEIDNGK